MSDHSIILEADHLGRRVENNGTPVNIVDDFSFAFARGKLYTVMGPSGAGKSSLLRLLNRLDESTTGDIRYSGESITKLSPQELRCAVGYLFQVPHLFPGSVTDNLRHVAPKLIQAQVDDLLQTVSLDPSLAERNAEELSLGQKQRVALARLLTTDPKVILLDEPTASLDPTYTERIERTVTKLIDKKKMTVIWVTHHPDQALRLGGQALLMVAGKLVERGDARQLVENPSTELGRRYRDRELT